MKVVDTTIETNLKEETTLTIREKLEWKKSESEIISLTQKHHAESKIGVDEVDNIQISISFYMRCQKMGTRHNCDSNSKHAYYIGVRSGKVVRMLAL